MSAIRSSILIFCKTIRGYTHNRRCRRRIMSAIVSTVMPLEALRLSVAPSLHIAESIAFAFLGT